MACSAAARRQIAASVGPCRRRPPSRMILLLDRVASSRCEPGQTVFPQLTGIPDRDSMGRIAHVRGFYFNVDFKLTASADHEAVSRYQLLALFTALFLEDVSGHQYWNNIDCRDVSDDTFFRSGRLVQWPYLHYGTEGEFVPDIQADAGLPENAPAGDYFIRCPVFLPMVNPRNEGSPFEGLVPLAALRDATNGGLRFRVDTAIKGADGPTPPAGVTFDGLFREGGAFAGFDVYVDVVYLPRLFVDAAWSVDSYTLTDMSTDLWHPDRATEYAAIRYHTDDAAQATNNVEGQLLANNWTGLTLSAGGMTMLSGASLNDAISRNQVQLATDFHSALSLNYAAGDLPVIDAAELAYAVPLIPHRGRETSAGGAINVRFTTRDAAFTRYLHRTVRCHSEDRLVRIARSARQNVGQLVSLDGKGRQLQGSQISSFMPVMAK